MGLMGPPTLHTYMQGWPVSVATPKGESLCESRRGALQWSEATEWEGQRLANGARQANPKSKKPSPTGLQAKPHMIKVFMALRLLFSRSKCDA